MRPKKMTRGSSVPYHLRPNKYVDREIFLDLLAKLDSCVDLGRYHYVGLGGPFLADFRLIHNRFRMKKLICLDSDPKVCERQKFNRPSHSISILCSTIEDYLDKISFRCPVVIWLDYTSAEDIEEHIFRFSRTITEVPAHSIIRITLNANPSNLGSRPSQFRTGSSSLATPAELDQEWRLYILKEKFGDLVPHDAQPRNTSNKEYGKLLLKILKIAVDEETISSNINVIWSLATHYADGQPMVTATAVVCRRKYHEEIKNILKNWEYASDPHNPLLLDVPVLSTLERITMAANRSPRSKMKFDLKSGNMGVDPFEAYEKYHRVLPHFSRVDF